MNNGIDSPCHGCERRTCKCHADCEAYIRFTEEVKTDNRNRTEYYRKSCADPHKWQIYKAWNKFYSKSRR